MAAACCSKFYRPEPRTGARSTTGSASARRPRSAPTRPTPSSRRVTGTMSCAPMSSEATARPKASSKQALVAARKVAESRDLTVRVFACRWIDETLFYRSPAYVAQIVRWLDAYIDPAIGDMQLAGVQLADVQSGDVLAIIKASADTPVTAERIRVIVQQFCNHAIRNLLVTTNPAQPLRGACTTFSSPSISACLTSVRTVGAELRRPCCASMGSDAMSSSCCRRTARRTRLQPHGACGRSEEGVAVPR